MFTGKRVYFADRTSYRRRRLFRFVNRSFQMKYTIGVMASVLFFLLLAGLPIIYMVRQNYQIFFELAYQSAPEMLEHLEKEILVVIIYFVSVLVAAAAFFFIMGIRFTARFASPVAIVERHMKKISKGQFFAPEIKIRSTDEFPDLIRSYNYLCAALRTNTKSEMELLRNIPLNPQDIPSNNKVRSLIEAKSNQITQQKVS